MDNINTWTGIHVEESIRMIEDRDEWRKYVHGVANTRIEDGKRTEQNGVAVIPITRSYLKIIKHQQIKAALALIHFGCNRWCYIVDNNF